MQIAPGTYKVVKAGLRWYFEDINAPACPDHADMVPDGTQAQAAGIVTVGADMWTVSQDWSMTLPDAPRICAMHRGELAREIDKPCLEDTKC